MKKTLPNRSSKVKVIDMTGKEQKVMTGRVSMVNSILILNSVRLNLNVKFACMDAGQPYMVYSTFMRLTYVTFFCTLQVYG